MTQEKSKGVIHCTQTDGCQRKWWHRLKEDPQLPYHFYSVKGIMTHAVIENCVKGEPLGELVYPVLLGDRTERQDARQINKEMYDACMPELSEQISNFSKWVEKTELDLDTFTSEERLSLDYKGYTLTGTPDLYNSTAIVDFKSGKRVVRDGYVQQLAAYHWMLDMLGKASTEEHYIIFFGDEKGPQEVKIPWETIEKGGIKFIDKLDETIKIIEAIKNEEYKPPCSVEFGCVFCEWRHLCGGI